MSKNNLIFPNRWILIRGLIRSQFHWFNFPDLLKTNLSIEHIDFVELPGNGYLSSEAAPKSLSAAILKLRSQISSIQEPVGLLGISLGGVLASQWALDFPEEVSHLALVNSSFGKSPFYERLRPQNYSSIFKLLIRRKPEDLESFIFTSTCNTLNWESYLRAAIQFQLEHPVRLSNFFQQLRLARSAHLCKKPQAKALILTAQNDRLVNHKCSQKIATSWNVPIAIHPNAGHDLPMDDSPWIADQMRKHFLD